MLQLVIPLGPEIFDDEKQELITPDTKTIQLEHSLVSPSKWESKWCKPFLSKEEKILLIFLLFSLSFTER